MGVALVHFMFYHGLAMSLTQGRPGQRGCQEGVAAPKSMPTEIVEKLNKEINTALADLKLPQEIMF
jgi:hypothetical protein